MSRLLPRGSGLPVFGVVSVQEGSGYALHRLYLFWHQVFSPSTGAAFPVELARALLPVGDVLPGVFLHDAGQFSLFDRDLQARVDETHGLQRFSPQVLVADKDLAP